MASSIETTERFDFTDYGEEGCDMTRDPDGQYVRFEDMVAIVAKYKKDAERHPMSCGTCKHFATVDYCEAMRDPDCIFTLCTWKPKAPFWMSAPFQGGPFTPNMAAIRKPTDGAECETWEAK